MHTPKQPQLDALRTATGYRPPNAPFAYSAFINNTWLESDGGGRYERKSPAHDVPVGTYPECTASDVDNAVAAARKAFDEGPWPQMSGADRAKVLNKVAALIRDHAEALAYLEVLESGKPIS